MFHVKAVLATPCITHSINQSFRGQKFEVLIEVSESWLVLPMLRSNLLNNDVVPDVGADWCPILAGVRNQVEK